MAAEIVGIDKINKYISKFDFKKIKLSKDLKLYIFMYVKKTKLKKILLKILMNL